MPNTTIGTGSSASLRRIPQQPLDDEDVASGAVEAAVVCESFRLRGKRQEVLTEEKER